MQGEIVVSAGASGAIFGVIGALFFVVVVNKGRIEDMSARRLGFLIIFSLYYGFSQSNVDNLAHMGGIISGVILAIILYRRKKHSCYFDNDIIQ
jgi:rhomboid protease GluP